MNVDLSVSALLFSSNQYHPFHLYQPILPWYTLTYVALKTESWKSFSLQVNNNLRMESKFIVFFTQILALFKFCHFCTAANPTTEASHCGTMLTIKSTCINPTCMKEYTWRSQPTMPGTRIAAGNFLLNMATLLAGGSISKVLQICKHMGLRTVSLVTFFKHQKVCM